MEYPLMYSTDNLILSTELIGSGKYGRIYAAKFHGKNIAVKIVYTNSKKDIEQEGYYLERMSDRDIGPMYYFGFFDTLDNKNDPFYKKYSFIGMFGMERYTTDVNTFLNDNCMNKNTILTNGMCVFVVQQMLILLRKLIFDCSMYCTDIKPENYLINVKKNYKVRMSDFGQFCSNDLSDTFKYSYGTYGVAKEVLYIILIIQLCVFIDTTVPILHNVLIRDDIYTKRRKYRKYILHDKYLLTHRELEPLVHYYKTVYEYNNETIKDVIYAIFN
jgi:hypothetical protein